MKFFILLLSMTLFLLGCTSSNTNPGYLYNKPHMEKLIPNKSSLSDVVAILGEPAISKMTFRKQLIYKYYYNMPNAIIDTDLMIKGNYSTGCKGCGEIIATFQWGATDNFQDFLLTDISMSDEQNKSAK